LLLDPAPDAPWRRTYGCWAAELPAGLPESAVAARATGRAIALTEHDLGWQYAVLNTAGLRTHLDDGLAGVQVHAGRAVGLSGPGRIALADGGELTARLVVDAGCKAISGERGLPSVKGIAGLKLKALHAEHAPIDILDAAVNVEIGDKIEIAVHYHDGTINLHRQMYGMRNGEVERVFTIEQ